MAMYSNSAVRVNSTAGSKFDFKVVTSWICTKPVAV